MFLRKLGTRTLSFLEHRLSLHRYNIAKDTLDVNTSQYFPVHWSTPMVYQSSTLHKPLTEALVAM